MKPVIALVIIIALALIYLNRSYSYFYTQIGQKNLTSPFLNPQLTLTGQKKNLPALTYLALGDSLSAGVGSSDFKQTFTYLFAQKLSQQSSQVTFINLAHMGDTTNSLIQNQLPKVDEFNPSVITVLIGVNDLHNFVPLDQFRQNFQNIIQALIKHQNTKIIVLTIPYLGSPKNVLFPYNFLLDYQTQRYNQVIKTLCQQNSAVNCLDLYSATKETVESDLSVYSEDGFHPNEKGYRIWSDFLNAN